MPQLLAAAVVAVVAWGVAAAVAAAEPKGASRANWHVYGSALL